MAATTNAPRGSDALYKSWFAELDGIPSTRRKAVGIHAVMRLFQMIADLPAIETPAVQPTKSTRSAATKTATTPRKATAGKATRGPGRKNAAASSGGGKKKPGRPTKVNTNGSEASLTNGETPLH